MKLLKLVWSYFYKIWMAFARTLALINTTLLLTLVYVLVIGPVAALVRVAGKDFLERKIGNEPTFWKDKKSVEHTLESMKHQF